MYESFYHLKANPFRLTPDPRFCFSHPAYQESRAYLQYAVELGEGFILLTGRPGAGKTTLVQSFLSSLNLFEVVAARVAVTDYDANDLLRTVAYNFNIDAEGLDKATLLRRIEQFFAGHVQAGRRVLLIIDEAQRLSHAALEELRLLADLQSGVRPLLQIFLVGQESLRGVMREPDMEQLQQRVIGTCRLAPMGLRETRDYVEHRLRQAGWQGDPELTGAATVAVYEYSRGVPRHINKLCTRLLLQGYMEKKHRLDGEDVDRIARELGEEQLAPLAGEQHARSGGDRSVAQHAVTGLDELAVKTERPAPAVAPPQDVAVAFAARPAAILPAATTTTTPPAANPVRSLVHPGMRRDTTAAPAVPAHGWSAPGRLVSSAASLAERPPVLFGLVAALTLSAGALTSWLTDVGDTRTGTGQSLLVAVPLAPFADEPATSTLPELPVAANWPDQRGASVPAQPAAGPTSDPASPPAVAVAAPSSESPSTVSDAESSVSSVAAAAAEIGAPGQAAPGPTSDTAHPEVAPEVAEAEDTAPVAAPPPGEPPAVVAHDSGDAAAQPAAQPSPAPQVALATVPVEPAGPSTRRSGQSAQLAMLLDSARAALKDNRLLIPAGNCAHYYYREALALDPGNPQAQAGIEQIVVRYTHMAGNAITRGDTEKADRYIERGLRVRPDNQRLLAMRSNLRVVGAPAVEPEAPPQELPPPVLEKPARPGLLERLKGLFANERARAPQRNL